MTKPFAAVVALGVLSISGCASVPLADRDADRAAKTFAVKPGLANIYIYRDESVGKAITMDVLVDGVKVGKTAKKTFIVRQVHPGRHTVISRVRSDSTISVVAEAGRNYFVWQEVKMGQRVAGSLLQMVEEDEGKRAVKRCALVQ